MPDATQFVAATDPRLRWRGHISLEPMGDAIKPWRIPYLDRELFPGVNEKAEMAAGVRIELSTDATWLMLDADLPAGEETRPAQVLDGGEVVDVVPGQHCKLPGEGRRTLSVWLPQIGTSVVRGIELPSQAKTGRPDDDEQPRWLTYGSSITHCSDATGPTRTWPARVATEAGLDLTCLGFGGECHLDPMVARVIRSQPADFISICAGINLHNAGTLNSRSFLAALFGTIETIREGHPDTPLCLISPIFSPPRENEAVLDLTLVDMRRVVGDVVKRLQNRGDEALHYVDGLSIFGPDSIPSGSDMKTLMPDDLHPADVAQPILAANVLRHVIGGAFGHDVQTPV